jgi:hypothetical protein
MASKKKPPAYVPTAHSEAAKAVFAAIYRRKYGRQAWRIGGNAADSPPTITQQTSKSHPPVPE